MTGEVHKTSLRSVCARVFISDGGSFFCFFESTFFFSDHAPGARVARRRDQGKGAGRAPCGCHQGDTAAGQQEGRGARGAEGGAGADAVRVCEDGVALDTAFGAGTSPWRADALPLVESRL